MSPTVLPAAPAASHVEAYCATGISPGCSDRIRVRAYGHLGYEVHGPQRARAIVVLGGISAGRHLAPTSLDPGPGWWEKVVGPGQALDPSRHRLIGVDYIGGPEASARIDRPVTTFDQAHAIAALLDHLDVPRATLIGSSYGGMVALAFSALFPDRADRLLIFCAAHRSHPLATAQRVIQRRAVRFAMEVGQPESGLALARALAMTTYRSAIEFEDRFPDPVRVENGVVVSPDESYLDARGADFARSFDPTAFLSLSESIDLHHVEGSQLNSPTTAVSFDTDTLVPPWLVEQLVSDSSGAVRHLPLSSRFGHDAFLKETGSVSDLIEGVLAGPEVIR